MKRKPLGRPPLRPIGDKLLIRIRGDEGPPVWAEVVNNSHRLVVVVTTACPIWRGARLHEGQFKEVQLGRTKRLYQEAMA